MIKISYGSFDEHARIAQEIKNTLRSGESWSQCNKEMKEALDMIAHKIGRIVNGDPRYKDSWTDLAGYATLVEKTLH
ncbi:MAG: hypothetical protein EBX03_13180 [Rhodobacteraceae bacterium]|nr:hypothetical protein [Paracoccaceae bacterium]